MKYVAILVLALAAPLAAQSPATVTVNEYFGVKYKQEPVSWDISLDKPAAAQSVRLQGAVSQAEVLEGTPQAATKVRLWTLVDFEKPGQQQFKVILQAPTDTASPITRGESQKIGDIEVATLSSGAMSAKIPVGSAEFAQGASAFAIPGPVVSISPDGKQWYGRGYLDTILRVRSVKSEVQHGPVFFESRITYTCDGGKTYVARARVWKDKPYVALVEDFNLGGASKFVFNYEDWAPSHFLTCSDQAQVKIRELEGASANDFVSEEGSTCIVRLCIWTQFGYFNGKSETIGLMQGDGSLGVGGFFNRPDRWTRAKLNHVDLYRRPEVPGQPMTRGVVGLAGAKDRYAMEAWIIDGHREWSLFAMPIGSLEAAPAKPNQPPQQKFRWNWFARKAHVVDGVWPLDRLNRLVLVWNSDGSAVAPENAAPTAATGGTGSVVLLGTEGRSGLQAFNGSESRLRGTSPPYSGWDGKVNAVKAEPAKLSGMIDPAICAYMSADDSACPSVRSMLPWTDPEAINPFYQGMENMNFNADRYRYTFTYGLRLAAMGHPHAKQFIDHAITSFDMALDRYVYPQSGCWEESHGYAGHTIKTVSPMVQALRNSGMRNFADDPRFARMLEFFVYVHSPVDAKFKTRIVPPIGDHGLSTAGPEKRLGGALDVFKDSANPEVRKIVSNIAGMIKDAGGTPPAGIEPTKPNLSSRYLQGYGSVLRAVGSAQRESFVIVRAEQSWGHHHSDKGSLWGWFRNVHFFGDASWGAPPGGTYFNQYKQGPAGHTLIEFVGINNWTLPCKYPAPWISDDQYNAAAGYDYVNARCMYPYNPPLDLAKGTPPATRNGYDRQVLLVHPDLLIVRDNLQTNCATIWRMHSFWPEGTTVQGGQAKLATDQQLTGHLQFVYPASGVDLSLVDRDDLNTYKDPDGNPLPLDQRPKFGSSVVIKWPMPASATWTFGVNAEGEAAPQSQMLDKEGKVTKVTLADGRQIIALLNIEPFEYSGEGIEFAGTVGLVIKHQGKTTVQAIRASKLTAQ